MLPVLKHLPGMLMAVSFSFYHVVRVTGRTFSDLSGGGLCRFGKNTGILNNQLFQYEYYSGKLLS